MCQTPFFKKSQKGEKIISTNEDNKISLYGVLIEILSQRWVHKRKKRKIFIYSVQKLERIFKYLVTISNSMTMCDKSVEKLWKIFLTFYNFLRWSDEQWLLLPVITFASMRLLMAFSLLCFVLKLDTLRVELCL